MIKDKTPPEPSEPVEEPEEKGGEGTKVEPVAPPTYDGEEERFKGKRFDEIVKSWKELDKEFGKQGSEFGKIRQERDALKQYYEYQMLQQQQQPAPQQQAMTPDSFWEKPAETTESVANRVVDQKLKQFETTLKRQQAMNSASIAKFQAKMQWPDVFDGIEESQLDQLIYGGIQSGTIAPEFASNPQGWAMSAWQLKGQQAGFKVPQGTPKAPMPPQSDAPPSVKTQGDGPPKLSSTAEEMLKMWYGPNLDEKTKKEIAEANEREAKIRRGE